MKLNGLCIVPDGPLTPPESDFQCPEDCERCPENRECPYFGDFLDPGSFKDANFCPMYCEDCEISHLCKDENTY